MFKYAYYLTVIEIHD